jgi:hypothetical protein
LLPTNIKHPSSPAIAINHRRWPHNFLTVKLAITMRSSLLLPSLAALSALDPFASGFIPLSPVGLTRNAAHIKPIEDSVATVSLTAHPPEKAPIRPENRGNTAAGFLQDLKHKLPSILLGSMIISMGIFSLPGMSIADESATYDGFAEYAKENQMEKSDVGCFMSKCGDQTKALFSNPRGIKGVSCLGRCKGEQSCAMRCFAEFSSADLNDWLSCTIEENECVKVPKNVDNSAEEIGYSTVVRNFDPKSLVGSWYKTDGLDPNYDLFDCQT